MAAFLARSGQAAGLLDALENAAVPEFWAPVRAALLARTTGDTSHLTQVSAEIADSAREFLARVDAEHPTDA